MMARTPASPASTNASLSKPTPWASHGRRSTSATVCTPSRSSWHRRAWPPPGSGAVREMRAPSVPSRSDQVSAQGDQPPEPTSRSTSACSPGPSTRDSPICRGSAAGPSAHSTPTEAVASGPAAVCSSLIRRVAPSNKAGCNPCLTLALAVCAAAMKRCSSAPDSKLQGSASVGAHPAPCPTSSRRRSNRNDFSTGSVSMSTSESRRCKRKL
mmetsp:Transcript_93217/g.259683  ORF Transcript_93217/g.259683 Transcript_93217/m.259683 type:complete len:212 (+) Transcript_93217:176-811(+)